LLSGTASFFLSGTVLTWQPISQNRHAGLDPASIANSWIPAFAGMTQLRYLIAGIIWLWLEKLGTGKNSPFTA
jgi:hypothetical protein